MSWITSALTQEDSSHADRMELVLDDNRMSQLQRELLERPENYL